MVLVSKQGLPLTENAFATARKTVSTNATALGGFQTPTLLGAGIAITSVTFTSTQVTLSALTTKP